MACLGETEEDRLFYFLLFSLRDSGTPLNMWSDWPCDKIECKDSKCGELQWLVFKAASVSAAAALNIRPTAVDACLSSFFCDLFLPWLPSVIDEKKHEGTQGEGRHISQGSLSSWGDFFLLTLKMGVILVRPMNLWIHHLTLLRWGAIRLDSSVQIHCTPCYW